MLCARAVLSGLPRVAFWNTPHFRSIWKPMSGVRITIFPQMISTTSEAEGTLVWSLRSIHVIPNMMTLATSLCVDPLFWIRRPIMVRVMNCLSEINNGPPTSKLTTLCVEGFLLEIIRHKSHQNLGFSTCSKHMGAWIMVVLQLVACARALVLRWP